LQVSPVRYLRGAFPHLIYSIDRLLPKFGDAIIQRTPFLLTARQYGEVVLPDAASGQGPGALVIKLSRCKEGMACFLPSWYKFYCVLARSRYKFDRSREFIPGYKVSNGHWRGVAVQFISKPESSHGAGFQLHADARVRVQQPLQICLEGRSKSKKHDKQLTHIVRVRLRFFL